MATEQEAFKIYIPVEDAAKLRALAVSEDRTVTAIFRRLLRDYLASRETEVAA